MQITKIHYDPLNNDEMDFLSISFSNAKLDQLPSAKITNRGARLRLSNGHGRISSIPLKGQVRTRFPS